MVSIVQLVRTPGCGPGGRGFKSHWTPFSAGKMEKSKSGKVEEWKSGSVGAYGVSVEGTRVVYTLRLMSRN